MIDFKESRPLKDLDSVSLSMRLRRHFVSQYPLRQVDMLDDAIQLASFLHRSDVRRGGRGNLPRPPYIEHPLRVAYRLTNFWVDDPNVYIAAVLHDTVEDHPYEFSAFVGVPETRTAEDARASALSYIRNTFGQDVAYIVNRVSNPIILPGTTKAGKVAAYLEHVSRTIKESPAACILKFSDLVDNAGSLHHHYAYDDPKVQYFIGRYSPLLPLYREVFEAWEGPVSDAPYNGRLALERLEEVEEHFAKFVAYA